MSQRILSAIISREFFGRVFPRFQHPPPPKKKVHLQDCHHSYPASYGYTPARHENIFLDLFPDNYITCINSVHTRCIVKTSGFTRGVCKNR